MDDIGQQVRQILDLAIGHQRGGRAAHAEAACREALALQPQSHEAMNLLGVVLCQTGRISEGMEALRRAVALDPGRADYHSNLGNALAAGGDLDAAIGAFRNALALRPDLADVSNNLGNALQEKGDAPGAIAAHHRAIELRPDYAQAFYNLGGAYKLAGLNDDAIAAYERAIQLEPAYVKAEVNRANILKDIGRLDEAIAGYQRAMRTAPSPVIEGNLIYCLYFHPDYDSRRIFEHLVRWEENFAAPLAREIVPHENPGAPGPGRASTSSVESRLRVGYVSPDFSVHPAGRFVLPLLANHDHQEFEVYCYSDLRTPDAMTARLRARADVWRETFSLDDAQLAQQVRDDRIDILVDLAVHTAGNRLLVFARKPAPIQVTWLGYPGSTGLKTIDYRLSDPHLDPPSMFDAFYSERTVRLPDCYWCYDPLVDPMEVGPVPASRNGFVTLGCLNNFAKVTGPVIERWAMIMRLTLGSRLLIVAPAGSARARFSERTGSLGIASDRIEFLDRVPRQEYLAYYRRIDVSLDPWPFNGGTTSFDSLWMGVPLVTMTGKTAVSRGGASILNNLGLTELIANDPGEYVEKASGLAGDLDRLAALRVELRGRMERSPLMDGKRFAANVEAAYRMMWRNWRFAV